MKATPPIFPTIDIAALQATAEAANAVIKHVRGTMLAPTIKKIPPSFSASELAELCGIEKGKVFYAAKKGDLPPGTKNGSKLEWPLSDALKWVREFRGEYLRDPKVAAGVVITIANFKGGVTKTTTAATLAQGLSCRGHKVLVIDADPQGSLTTLYGFLPNSEVDEEQTILPLLVGDTDCIMSAVQSTYWEGIDLVAAAPMLYNAEFILPARQQQDSKFEFWRVLDSGLDKAKEVYDVIIIDTPPSLSYVTINALIAAQGVIMPLPPSTLDFASSAQFWNLFTETCAGLFRSRGDNKKFHFVDVLLSRVDRTDSVSSSVRQWIISAYGNKVIPVEIPKTSTAASASAEFGTVYDLDRSSVQPKTLKRARDAYDQFVEYIEMQISGVWAADATLMAARRAK